MLQNRPKTCVLTGFLLMQTRVGYVEMYNQKNSGGPRLAPRIFIFTFIYKYTYVKI